MTEPINMFCGLPIKVAAEPMLAAQAKAKANGTGLSPRCQHTRTTTGVMAKQITSLENTADKAPATPIKTASKAAGDKAQVPTVRVTAA
jgi:hypothetical protein